MKRTICEKLMWSAMTPTIFEYIASEFQNKCGLCALGKQEHCENLIPYMCEMDYISVELMGGVLHRTGTIATGAECCDFSVLPLPSPF